MSGDPILAAFRSLARRHPERLLVLSSARTATIGDVETLARAVAALVDGEKLEKEAVVGLAAPNGPAFLAGFLALRSAGHGVVLLDPKAPDADLRRTAGGLGASALAVCRTGWPRGVEDWFVAALPTAEGEGRPGVPGAPIVKVTSGSTGRPRGVCASAENVCADEGALFTTMGLRDEERILASVPMAHSYGLSSVALPALLRGSPVVVPDEGSPLAPLEAARTAGATFFPTVPAYLQGLVALARPEMWPRTVRVVVSAGALLPAATAAAFRELYAQPVHCFYGASESGGICYDRDGRAAERGTVGTPVDGTTVRLEALPGSPDGEGAVTVASAAVARGYVGEGDPRLEGGVFRTSDRGAWRGGELHLCGRIDGLINVKGKKVDPAEIERVLLELDGVEEVVVVGVPSRGYETVRAVVACRPGALTAADVLAFCRKRLAEHKVPRSVRLVAEIPRTARGKVDRQVLAAADAPGWLR